MVDNIELHNNSEGNIDQEEYEYITIKQEGGQYWKKLMGDDNLMGSYTEKLLLAVMIMEVCKKEKE